MHARMCGSLLSSFLSPSTSNMVKQPFKLSALHSETPGNAKAWAGGRLDAWMCTNVRWVLAAVLLSMVSSAVWPTVPTLMVCTACIFVTSVLVALCSNVGVLKKLLKVAGVWYVWRK